LRQLSFKRHRFPPNIISHTIWLYARFTLSFRDVTRAMVAAWVEARAIGDERSIPRMTRA
jgi:transposase-like protein